MIRYLSIAAISLVLCACQKHVAIVGTSALKPSVRSDSTSALEPSVRYDSTGIEMTLPCVLHTPSSSPSDVLAPCAAAGLDWQIVLWKFSTDSPGTVRGASGLKQPSPGIVRVPDGLKDPRNILIAGLPWEPPTREYRTVDAIQKALEVRACAPFGHIIECSALETGIVTVLGDGRLRLRILSSSNVVVLWRLHPELADLALRIRGVPQFSSTVRVRY